MTTIAYKDGVLATDSWSSQDEQTGVRRSTCKKLFRKTLKKGTKQEHDVLIGVSGDLSPALVFVDWYGTKKPIPESLNHHGGDFSCLILTPDGLYEADIYCRLAKVEDPYYAIGSGSMAAMAAMRCGKNAKEAVRIAASIDPYTGGKVQSMSLENPRTKRLLSERSKSRVRTSKNRRRS